MDIITFNSMWIVETIRKLCPVPSLTSIAVHWCVESYKIPTQRRIMPLNFLIDTTCLIVIAEADQVLITYYS